MPKNEPQSYGSQADWSTGRTGQSVNDPKAAPPEQHRDFYDAGGESGPVEPYDGGRTSPVQLAENDAADGTARDAGPAVQKVTARDGGAKRNSFFRRRDYD